MKDVIKPIINVRYWIIVLLLLLVFQADTVYAKENSGQCGDDVYWTLSDKGVMTISGTGKMWDFRNDADSFDYHECPWKDIKADIKKVVFKSGITYVGADAFSYCTNITKVTFTNSIKTIAPFAFMGCENLENVTLPKELETLGQQSFYGCVKITQVSIPDTVTFLDDAFQYCTALKEVYIGGMDVPSYVSYRGALFNGCTALEKIEVSPDNIALTVIDGMLYEKETGVLLQYPLGDTDKKVVLPESTKAIVIYAMSGASYLEEIELPNGLESIERGAFSNCIKLKSLTIPSSVSSIADEITMGCDGLSYIKNNSDASLKMVNGYGSVWIDKDGNVVENLQDGIAYKHGFASGVEVEEEISLYVGESIVIPESISYANDSIPQNREDLIFESSNSKIATVDENGKVIAKKAGTVTITIRNRYTDEWTRWMHSFETTCTITVKKADKTSIKKAEVTLSKNNYTYNGKAKKPSVTVVLGGKKLKKNTDYTVSYENNKNIGKATVVIKGKGKYTGTIKKTFTIKVEKGDTFTSGKYKYKVTGSSTVAFNGIVSTKTTKVTIPKTVKYGGKTFKVTSIADSALKKKTKVTSVTIGANVKTIGKNAFYGCTKLKTITIKSTKLEKVGKDVFKKINSKATIKVPKSELKDYKKLLKGKGQGSKVKIKSYKN